jgi:AAA+ superfamily predicted ATPase
MKEAEKVDPPPALTVLARQFNLSEFEQEILLLCASVELDTRVAGLCAGAQGDISKRYPTFALALAVFGNASWDVLSPELPLRYWRMIEISRIAAQPLTTSALRADERIVNYLKGLNYLDERLSTFAEAMFEPGPELSIAQADCAAAIAKRVKAASTGARMPLVQLAGTDSRAKALVALSVTGELGLHLYRISLALAPSQPADAETLARIWHRETLLSPLALYLTDGRENTAAESRFIAHDQGLCFCDVRERRADLSRSSITFDIVKPSREEQRLAWAQCRDGSDRSEAELLATQFNFNLPDIRSISIDEQTDGQDVWNVCLAAMRPQLDSLAQRIEPKASFEDLILPETEKTILSQVLAHVRQRGKVYDDWGFRESMSRGLGVTALFAGGSGTGKTMAVEALARELRLNLYRIDLSQVVDKYIGQTEKNLCHLFDGADRGGVILQFDEADALFGKRSEVKDSHDRYSNIEITYLLQRLETFQGLAVLTTNMKSALDTAFLRRLRFVVNFPFPGPCERRKIWMKTFPSRVPLAPDVNFESLAALSLTGANIQSIALGAAFLAADRGERNVCMQSVLDAARMEFRKLERPTDEVQRLTTEAARA